MSDLDEFLAGGRLDDVAFFLHSDVVSSPDALEPYATPVEDGLVVVIDGQQGRAAFQGVTGVDPMTLASQARQRDGDVASDLSGGACPESGEGADGGEHEPRFVFAFAEAQNEDVGDVYAEGDVMHAYVNCSCGTLYSDRWVIDGAV